MSDPTPNPTPKPNPADPADTDRRLRERVEKLVAQAPAVSAGSAALAGGRQLDYRATVEFLPVADGGFAGALGEPQAAVMTTSYVATPGDPAAPRQRPVCFAFNGGPGSASVWLHLGALGPKRVVVPDDARHAAPPYALADNPETWLEHFDLVFIDPPHTGWSVCAGEAARKKMLSVDGDVQALTEVMRVWLTRHRRWTSPVYLAGESYGTTRGAALAESLLNLGAPLAGVILVSCAMDLQTLEFVPANDLPYALFLPGFAAVSQYHGLLKGPEGASGAAAREAAEAFVDEHYASALLAGARMTSQRRGRIAQRIAELTGLPRALVEAKNLRISDRTYFVEAMRAQGRVVGRLDARGTAPVGSVQTNDMEFDPGIEAIVAPYTACAMDHFAGTLGVSTEQRYEVLSRDTHKAWNWQREGGSARIGFASTTPELARALRRNPQLRVFVASGRYDLGTPYSATDWSLAQLDVPAELLAARVTHRYYDAGHMMYTREADLRQLKADLAAWLEA